LVLRVGEKMLRVLKDRDRERIERVLGSLRVVGSGMEGSF